MVHRRVRVDSYHLQQERRRGAAHRREGLLAAGVSEVRTPGVVRAAVRRVQGEGKAKLPEVRPEMELKIFNK